MDPVSTTTMPAGTHAAALTLTHAIGVMQEAINGVVRRGNLDQADADRLSAALADLDAALVAAAEQVTA